MKKKILRALAVLLGVTVVAAAAVVFPVIRDGVAMYHEAMQQKTIASVVSEVREDPDYVTIDHISNEFLQQVIRSEDHRFYRHCGIDLIATGRALVHDIAAGAFVEGGSTITQQLAKNLYFSGEKKCERKVAELLTAFDLERELTKDEILELYCNIAYFGEGCYGIGEAAPHYYDVQAEALSHSEAASLVFTLKCPNEYNPNVYQALSVQ